MDRLEIEEVHEKTMRLFFSGQDTTTLEQLKNFVQVLEANGIVGHSIVRLDRKTMTTPSLVVSRKIDRAE
jgi:hypothetical protein